MFNFSSGVESVLVDAGWFPTRIVDASQWIEPLEEVGFRAFPVAVKLLENLGGLKIVPPRDESNLFYPSEIIFDPVFAASSEFDRVEGWQEKYDMALFPLGEYDPIYIMMCSVDGRIFGARGQSFYFLGNTIEEALELRIFAKRKPILYRPQGQ